MLTQPTIDKLRALKLNGMANVLIEQLKQPPSDLDFESRLAARMARSRKSQT